jgi:hypothetical protein
LATINFATREITAKIVYIGASGAGCNTNVRRLYSLLEARETSRLHKFGPGDTEERSWYFEYVVLGPPRVGTFLMRYRVYSLPGGLSLPAHRDEVLRDCDAIVLVADSRPDKAAKNVDVLFDLERTLAAMGIELSTVPLVLQLNHRDDESALPVDQLTSELNPFGFPVTEAIARAGDGVMATHSEVTAALEARLRDHLAGNAGSVQLSAIHEPDRETDDDVVRAHVEAIRERSEAEAQADIDELTQRHFEHLPEGPEVEVAFQPREYLGSSPTKVLGVEVGRDEVRLDLVMEHMGGGEARRLTVRLMNRPTDAQAVTRSTPRSTVPPVQEVDRVFDYLPDEAELTTPRPLPELPADAVPPMVYGLVGIVGGVLIGALSAYLVGALG